MMFFFRWVYFGEVLFPMCHHFFPSVLFLFRVVSFRGSVQFWRTVTIWEEDLCVNFIECPICVLNQIDMAIMIQKTLRGKSMVENRVFLNCFTLLERFLCALKHGYKNWEVGWKNPHYFFNVFVGDCILNFPLWNFLTL